MNVAILTIRLIRPHHWIKNVIILFPVVFAMRMRDASAWVSAAVTLAAFCMAAGATYAINDVRDRERDREHPTKRKRPIASGQMSKGYATGLAVLLVAVAMLVAGAVNGLVAGAIAVFLALQCLYTFALKRHVILDVMCIAMGFVLRASAGALAIRAPVSPWLVICTFTLCLFMGFCKRRNEVAVLADGSAVRHRATLEAYTPELLSHLITLSAGIAIVSYLLYTVNPRTVANFHSDYLVYTLPFVIYGVFRFAMLSIRGRYDGPTELILTDRPFQITVLLWFASAVSIILWGPMLADWLARWAR